MVKKLVILFFVVFLLAGQAAAAAPEPEEAYKSVPEGAIIPEENTNFSEGVGRILSEAFSQTGTSIRRAAGICGAMMAIVLLCALFSTHEAGKFPVRLVGILALTALFTGEFNTLLQTGTGAIQDMSEYGKLLLPVMAAAMTTSGQPGSSAALYLGTALFDSLLLGLIGRLLIPSVYVYLSLSVANGAVGGDTLKRMRDFIKGAASWGLRIVLYVFTGYMALTGVISGRADASAVKAAKLTISTVVPVVGGILSDASEAVVLGAEVIRGSAGLYGALAILGICAAPFLRLGIQYLMLKASAAVCAVCGGKELPELVDCFSQALGLVLAMTGACCLIQIISVVCFMKGVG